MAKQIRVVEGVTKCTYDVVIVSADQRDSVSLLCKDEKAAKQVQDILDSYIQTGLIIGII